MSSGILASGAGGFAVGLALGQAVEISGPPKGPLSEFGLEIFTKIFISPA